MVVQSIMIGLIGGGKVNMSDEDYMEARRRKLFLHCVGTDHASSQRSPFL